MRRKKHNVRKRFRNMMRGVYCQYDGNDDLRVEMYHPTGRRLTDIEANAVAIGAWRWQVDVTVRARMSELLRWESVLVGIDQWVMVDDIGAYIDETGKEIAESLPLAWTAEAVTWKAVIIG